MLMRAPERQKIPILSANRFQAARAPDVFTFLGALVAK